MKVDVETLKTFKEIFTQHNAGEIVSIHSQNKDSFAALRGGIKDNYLVIGLFVSAGWFIFTSINDGKVININQDLQIEGTVKALELQGKDIQQLNTNIQALNTSQLNTYNELIRKIDALSTAVEQLKANK